MASEQKPSPSMDSWDPCWFTQSLSPSSSSKFIRSLIFSKGLLCAGHIFPTPLAPASLELLSFHSLPFSAIPQFSQPLLMHQVSPTPSDSMTLHPSTPCTSSSLFWICNFLNQHGTPTYHTMYDTTCRRFGKGSMMAGWRELHKVVKSVNSNKFLYNDANSSCG